MANLNKLNSFIAHNNPIWSISSHPSKPIFATSSDKYLKLWDNSSTQLLSIETPHTRTIRSVAWSCCGNYIASSSFDSKTIIWEFTGKDMEVLTTLKGHESEVKCSAWSKDGSFLATCGRDRSVWVWNITEDMDFEIMSIMQDHTHDVKSVAWHPNKNLLVSTSYDNTIKFWDYDASCDDWVCKQSLEEHKSTVWKAAFSSNGNYLATVSGDESVMLWKCKEDRYQVVDKVSVGNIQYSCEFSAVDDKLLFTCGERGSISIFRIEDGLKEIKRIKDLHECDINCISFLKGNVGLLCSAADDGTVNIYSTI